MSKTPLYVGVDAGGTKTEINYRFELDGPIHRLNGPGTNLQRDGIQVTSGILSNLLLQTGISLDPEDPLHLCLGISGAGRPAEQSTLKQKLSSLLDIPPNQVLVLSDAEIAFYAAHQNNSGILMIVGTGSIIWAKTLEGDLVRAGGWGFLLNDEGGGFQLGLAGLKAVVNMIDGGPATLLKEKFCSLFNLCTGPDFLEYAYGSREHIQKLAPHVLEVASAHDGIALQIVDEQIASLTKKLSWLLNTYPSISPRIAIMGGLSNNDFYRQRITNTLKNNHAEFDITMPGCSPAEAALALAQNVG